MQTIPYIMLVLIMIIDRLGVSIFSFVLSQTPTPRYCQLHLSPLTVSQSN